MGIIFDGVTSKSKKINMRITSWQTLSSLRNAFVTIPGKHGVVDFGCTSAEKIIDVSCSILPQPNFESLVNILDSMAEWLDPDNGLKQLMFDGVPGRYYMARLSDAVDCERLLRSSSNFTLKFVCPDPHAYATVDESFTINSVGTTIITREKGNVYSEPVYYLKGTSYNDPNYTISIITNGVEMNIRGRLGTVIVGNDVVYSDETLIIDSGRFTAKIVDSQGETLRNGLPLLVNMDFPVLRKGTNIIEIKTNAAVFRELRIAARSRWR